jgi:hypothetical protein
VGELLDMSSSDNPARALAVLAYLNSGKLEAIADGRVASKIRRVSFELIWLGSAGQNRAIRTGLLAGLDFVPSSLAIPFLLEEASQGSDSERRSVMVQMKERLRQEPTIGTKNADLESEERTRVLWQNRRLGIALRESELFLNDLADTDERVRKAADTGLARIFRNEVQGLSLNNAGISDRSNLWKIRIEQWRKKSPD